MTSLRVGVVLVFRLPLPPICETTCCPLWSPPKGEYPTACTNCNPKIDDQCDRDSKRIVSPASINIVLVGRKTN